MARASRLKATRRFDVEIVTRAMLSVLLGDSDGLSSEMAAPIVDRADLILSNR
jgi:hypothetical protein